VSAEDLTGASIEGARRALARRFKTAKLESPELDARLLVGRATQLDLTGLTVQATRLLSSDEATLVNGFAERRLRGEPIARILGSKEFWGLDFILSPDTLVPRPDTETLVETGLSLLRTLPDAVSPCIADIGTGSGAILLALLSERRDATGIGTDINSGALSTATLNAHHLGLADRASFILCNYAEALPPAFDLIVSNPPYIASNDIADLDVEVRDFDPLLALDGGRDGLSAYRILAPEVARLLRPNGGFALEVGHRQAADVAALMETAGLSVDRPYPRDLSGVPRVVSGRKRAE
jgi:release factor glutamine methyltransferase